MTKTQLALRTFGWAAVGFLVTSGAVVALGAEFDAGNYSIGLQALAIALISAVLAGIVAALQSLKFPANTAGSKALSQFVQMLVAGLAVLAVADLTEAAAVAFVGAVAKLVVAAFIGGVQAYLVNLPRPAPSE